MDLIAQNLPRVALWAAAYLLGSIPSGLVLARAFGNVDIRRRGSGNIGATNVARVAGAGLGLATLTADVLKGALPVCLAQRLDPAEASWVAAALLAFLGHLFPVFTGFRGGGKGVATALGGFLVLAPAAVGAGAAAFAAVFAAGRRVSAASLAAALLLPAAAALMGQPPVVWAGAAGASVLIFWRHAENIRRLLAGTEPVFRFGRPRG
ncbi:MAG: glycerol-3-phosphate 1-O-acyltransferase PlsY [Desulfobacterales bacterium]|jgi:glycerol-3-phosphate acyltransferase PlsY|nr:glycerol-3-phosphate 1-O-acyltransferase PlsY [Desulfobacterales bacterium]